MGYCCTQGFGSFIQSHNKKLISSNNKIILPCNCRRKEDSPLQGKCRANDIVNKYIALATGFPNKNFLGTAQGEFIKRV